MTVPTRSGPARAALYARVSRPDERPILENQLASLRSYAKDRGLVPAGEYVDVASGGSDNRPGLNRLLSEATRPRNRPFDLVAFTSLSRMTRGGVAAALELLRRLESAGVGWVFVEQPILNNDSTTPKLARDILLSVLAAVDEDYRARISRATKAAFARRKGLKAGSDLKRWGRHPNGCDCPKHRGKGSPPGPTPTTGGPRIAPIS